MRNLKTKTMVFIMTIMMSVFLVSCSKDESASTSKQETVQKYLTQKTASNQNDKSQSQPIEKKDDKVNAVSSDKPVEEGQPIDESTHAFLNEDQLLKDALDLSKIKDDGQDNSKTTKFTATYRVATTTNMAPFSFLSDQSRIIGFDMDLIYAIGIRAGFRVKFIPTIWSGIFDGLNKDDFQIVASAVVSNPELKNIADTSIPYMNSARGVLFLNNKYTSLKELRDLRFVTQANTTNIPILKGLYGPNIKLQTVKTPYLEIQHLVTHKADVAYDDAHALMYHVQNIKDLSYGFIVDKSYKPDQFVFAVKKDNTALREKINDGLIKVIQDGTYKKIYERWFGKHVDNYGIPKGALQDEMEPYDENAEENQDATSLDVTSDKSADKSEVKEKTNGKIGEKTDKKTETKTK